MSNMLCVVSILSPITVNGKSNKSQNTPSLYFFYPTPPPPQNKCQMTRNRGGKKQNERLIKCDDLSLAKSA